ncbi:putative nepenthesin [Helianthus annuus]|uniref:Nepenthesin n=2 Tax=Helianthus annuus TaxID=4232 RepID=A0A9K3NBU0_HELAN|nr:putative nepenthesin [Helianthus annuus]KAJ0538157.1 putative nepenthesin [Helianthus annuus]KAJ0545939.1 putative nepenthesin [Helianthus annuus]KAJ0718462.1 putative nepenthesin [Helianthus annuus]KAJ0721707.1 putative nepenthesin [Helianthus annuus]
MFINHSLNYQLSLMASFIFHILSLILFHLFLASSARTPTRREQTGIRATLTLVDSGQTLPKYTSTNPLTNDPSASLVKSPLKASRDVYSMNLAIGTPPVSFSAMMDTGSDLIWTKCKTRGSGSARSFDPSESKTFSQVDKSCTELKLDGCNQNYADGNSVSVSLGQETLKVGDENFKNVTFACGTPDKDIPYDGILGMGRGDLSLVSQLKESVFLYCLGSRFEPKTSSVLLTGSKATSQNINTQTTPLLKQDGKSYYYVSLEGISVGKTKLAVTKSDFAISSYDGSGGMIIDSGTTFTYLEKGIVNMISDEFIKQTKLVKHGNHNPYMGLEHCFKPPGNVHVPNVVFHFEGADWVLQRQNYIYEKNGKNVACLAFIANNEDYDHVSIFGNMNQQNMMVVYDLDNNNLSFKPADCKNL